MCSRREQMLLAQVLWQSTEHPGSPWESQCFVKHGAVRCTGQREKGKEVKQPVSQASARPGDEGLRGAQRKRGQEQSDKIQEPNHNFLLPLRKIAFEKQAR